jgi:hypothetical protein
MLKRFWPLLTIIILVVLAAIILPAAATLMPKHPRFPYDEQAYLTKITLGTSLVNFPDDVKVGEPFEVYGQLSYLASVYMNESGQYIRTEFPGGTWLPLANQNVMVYLVYDFVPQTPHEVLTDSEGYFHITLQIDEKSTLSWWINAIYAGEEHMYTYPSHRPLSIKYLSAEASIPSGRSKMPSQEGFTFTGLSSVIVEVSIAFTVPFIGVIVYFIYRYRKKLLIWLKRRKIKVTVQEPAGVENLAAVPEAALELSTGDPRVEILFPQIENPLPPVWGINEPLTILCRALIEMPENHTKSSPQIKASNLALDIFTPGFSPVHLEHIFNRKGEIDINVHFGSDTGEKIFGTRKIRIVDYREEIVVLFSRLIDSLSAQGIAVDRMMTAREIESQLKEKNPDIAADVMQDIVRGFESANYSLQPVARKIYIDMYLAVGQIWEQVKNA